MNARAMVLWVGARSRTSHAEEGRKGGRKGGKEHTPRHRALGWLDWSQHSTAIDILVARIEWQDHGKTLQGQRPSKSKPHPLVFPLSFSHAAVLFLCSSPPLFLFPTRPSTASSAIPELWSNLQYQAMMSASASSGVPVVASTTYDPPGSLSANGPRHDNDHAEIKDIQIVPTQAELTCQRPPFLPSNDVRNARHHLPIGWSQLLDTHFRLYREDMIDQIRKGVLIYLKALKTAPNHRSDLLNRSRLRQLVGQDVIANAYGNIEFLGINDKLPGTDKDSPRGTIQVSFDQPYKIRSTTLKKRKFFWKKSRRRLMPNSLVCFFYPACDVRNNKEFCVSLGVIHKYESRLFGLARDKTKATLCVTMINSVEYCRIILAVKNKNISPRDIFMVESTGDHFESYRPILQALQMIDPGSMPLGKYIAPKPHEGHVPRVNPPQYALAPGFEFNLSVLFKSTSNIRCRLNVKDSASRKQAESIIRSYTTMDDTQSQALVNSLCREVALISG